MRRFVSWGSGVSRRASASPAGPLRSVPWRGFLAVALCGLGFAVVGCNEGADDVLAPFQPTLTADLRLLDSTGRARIEFDQGEAITFELSVTNLTSYDQTTSFASAKVYDFSVQGPSGDWVWRWSRDRGFAAVITELHFAPHETRVFTEVWDQMDDAGKPVGLGDYTALGSSSKLDIVRFRIE